MPDRTKGGIFITGAAAGIGAATTRLLAGQGYPVYAGVHKDTGALRLELAAWDIPVCVVEPGGTDTQIFAKADAAAQAGLAAADPDQAALYASQLAAVGLAWVLA